ncbi:O-antigen translocase [Tatumella morbirosei]|uniref:O-antigen translocase n=1 Tax=Tatumella morbirosei TaxID=642227 RepID=A0A095TUC2_9GAMM|nr:lipid III flippase WzxE [Tatumella morbirosei]KGD80149.1 O-antigen translocase [Tatumella morbirosei]
MSLAKASVWTSFSTLIKILAGLLVVKLLAVSYGPEGIGLAGNFRQMVTVLGVLAGAGIFNGVTRYVAEYQEQPARLQALTATSSSIIMGSSLLLCMVFSLAAAPISELLFGSDHYRQVIRIVAFLQAGIAWANLLQAQLKGYRNARANALVVAGGSLLGVAGYLLCWLAGGYSGALAGIALVPAISLLPAIALLKSGTTLQWRWFIPQWDPGLAALLFRYTLMALMTAITLPVAWIIMRNLLAAHAGWQQVGLWQGVTSISDAWLQFITATFSVWLLPTLAKQSDKQATGRVIFRALRFVMPVVAGVALLVWLLRDVAIWLLFTAKFAAMRDLFVWQLTGDFFKVGAYVFGYLVIAKASLRFYLLTELSQFVLLLASASWLIPVHGVSGAVQAYCLTYMLYFALCGAVFMYWYRK